MTVNKLIEELQELQKSGYGEYTIRVPKGDYDAYDTEVEHIPYVDSDCTFVRIY